MLSVLTSKRLFTIPASAEKSRPLITTRWRWVCGSSRSSWTGNSSPPCVARFSPCSPDSRCQSSRSLARPWWIGHPSRVRMSPRTPCPPPGCWWRYHRNPSPPRSAARRSWWWSGGRRWPRLWRYESAPGEKIEITAFFIAKQQKHRTAGISCIHMI